MKKEDTTHPFEGQTAINEARLKELNGTVIENYVIEGFLGLGGQAVVLLAHGRSVATNQYALKVFGLLGESSSRLDHGLSEAQSQSLVDHPSVVKVSEPGIADVVLGGKEYSILFIPMQYAPLGNCDDHPPFVNRELIQDDYKTLIGLLDGLNHIHNRGILHRDIKPANILCFEERHAAQSITVLRITDFGIAKVLSALGNFGDAASGLTPAYMAPEQVDNQYTEKSDIYSMGATLFYMLTGKNPVEVPNSPLDIQAWQAAHRKSPRPNPIDINPFCRPRLALLVMQMMSVDPVSRPSLEECIEVLNNHIAMMSAQYLGFRPPDALRTQLTSDNFQIRYLPDFNGIFDPAVHVLCGTAFYSIRLQMSHPVFLQYRLLIEQVVKKFADCFCLYETYGTFDIHIFVWSDRSKIEELESSLSAQFADAIEVSSARQIVHLHSENANYSDANINVVGALAIQEKISLDGVDTRWYLGGVFPEDTPVHSVRAFIYVTAVETNPRDRKWMRLAIFENIHRKMKEMAKLKVDVIENEDGVPTPHKRKRFPRLSLIEVEDDPKRPHMPVAIINYVARDYKFLPEITTAITELGDTAVKTSTFLESGRIIVQSDKILF